MSFTIVNFLYLFHTIVKGFYLNKLLSVTSHYAVGDCVTISAVYKTV